MLSLWKRPRAGWRPSTPSPRAFPRRSFRPRLPGGCLAIVPSLPCESFRGQGVGGALLADAVRRVSLSPPAVFALVVDAKDDLAVAFYQHHGFQPFISQPRTLFLPMATAEKVFR